MLHRVKQCPTHLHMACCTGSGCNHLRALLRLTALASALFSTPSAATAGPAAFVGSAGAGALGSCITHVALCLAHISK